MKRLLLPTGRLECARRRVGAMDLRRPQQLAWAPLPQRRKQSRCITLCHVLIDQAQHGDRVRIRLDEDKLRAADLPCAWRTLRSKDRLAAHLPRQLRDVAAIERTCPIRGLCSRDLIDLFAARDAQRRLREKAEQLIIRLEPARAIEAYRALVLRKRFKFDPPIAPRSACGDRIVQQPPRHCRALPAVRP